MTIILMSKHSYMLINGILWLAILMKGAYMLSQTSILRKQQVPVRHLILKLVGQPKALATVGMTFLQLGGDIIGVVEDFEHVSSIKTKFGQMNIVRFRITDGMNSHKFRRRGIGLSSLQKIPVRLITLF
ncbi:hypothetical protein POM88_025991 [Heracleum sosnowskyi]|uniref:Uncharacterized protein n=1 Tax=Heracleum sosnowskyi TaxID=360622 RepID=A0AAD8MNG0_9APIA|nr:hypothetical protein POM88_025991 [Heracleum sosnowskyi]